MVKVRRVPRDGRIGCAQDQAEMKLSYSITKKVLEKGALKHFDHRYKFRRIFGPIVGVVSLGYGIWFISVTSGAANGALGGVLLGLGLVLLTRKWLYAKKAAGSAFRGRKEGGVIEFYPSKDGLAIKDDDGESRCKWSNFVDFHVTDEGVLIYPAYRIFYWIPASAEISDGDWSEFTKLISESIKKTA